LPSGLGKLIFEKWDPAEPVPVDRPTLRGSGGLRITVVPWCDLKEAELDQQAIYRQKFVVT
jgi:hypothetical protein